MTEGARKNPTVSFESEDSEGNAGVVTYTLPEGFDTDQITEEIASDNALLTVWENAK